MDVKSNLIFMAISLVGCIICAVVIKVKNDEWKKEGNEKARTVVSILFIAFMLSSILTQAYYWMS